MSRSELLVSTVSIWCRRRGVDRSFDDVHLRCCAEMQKHLPAEPPVSDVEVHTAIRSSPEWQAFLAR